MALIKASNKNYSKVRNAVESVYANPTHRSAILIAGGIALVTSAIVAVVCAAMCITVVATLASVLAMLALPVITVAIVVAICVILIKLT
jgi:hypothetical protein